MPLLNIYQKSDLPNIPPRVDAIDLYTEDKLVPADLDHMPTGLRTLYIRGVRPDTIAHLAARFPALEALRISIDGLSEDAFAPLAALKALRSLDLWGSRTAKLPDLTPLAHITALTVWEPWQLDTLLGQLDALPALEALDLWHTPRLTAAAMAAIATCPKLQRLRVSSAEPREPDAFAALQSAPALRRFVALHDTPPSATEALALAAIPTLHSAHVAVSTTANIAALKPLHDRIERLALHITGGSLVDDAWLDTFVDTLPGLRGLNLLGAQQRRPKGVDYYTPAGLARLGALKQLEWLDTGHLPKEVKPEHMAWLAQLPALQHLHIYGHNISAKIADTLKDCAALRTLSLSDVKLSDAAAKKLAGLKLERLRLHHAPLTDKGIVELSKIKTLQALYMLMDKGQLGDAGLKALAALPALDTLQIDLWSSAYTATSLAPLAASTTLQRLTLDPHVTAYSSHAGGLATLANAPALWRVELGTYSQGPLDPAAAAALKTIPNLLLVGAITQGHDLLTGHALATTQFGLQPDIVPPLQNLD